MAHRKGGIRSSIISRGLQVAIVCNCNTIQNKNFEPRKKGVFGNVWLQTFVPSPLPQQPFLFNRKSHFLALAISKWQALSSHILESACMRTKKFNGRTVTQAHTRVLGKALLQRDMTTNFVLLNTDQYSEPQNSILPTRLKLSFSPNCVNPYTNQHVT